MEKVLTIHLVKKKVSRHNVNVKDYKACTLKKNIRVNKRSLKKM